MFQFPATPSEHNDLEQLKRQAKELLKACEAGEKPALDLVNRHYHPAHPGGFSLTAAKLVIARHHGFGSWEKLRAHVDRVNLRRLTKAVEAGNVSLAKTLLQRRPELVNMDMAENDEHRALHYAVLRRDEPMVRLLMAAGADAHKGIFPHRDATTAYILARERGFDDIVAAIEEEERAYRQALGSLNARVSPVQDVLNDRIRRGEETEAITLLEENPGLTHACDREGGTPLHIACEEASLKVIDWLLQNHADPRKQDAKGRTPLERAVGRVYWKERNRRFEFPEIARRLLGHGATISPLVAAALGDLEALRSLHRQAPPTEGAWSEANTLSTAVLFGNFDAVKLLLDLGLDPNEKVKLRNLDEEVYSQGHPLWLAATFGEYEIARLLLERGADPMGEVYASGTPVDRAYGAGDERMKQLLADYGGQPSAFTIGGQRDTAGARRLLDNAPSEATVRDLLWAAACGGEP
ncbi:MAG TPA: ankyrin repeat domain-containing protein, partial [Chthoniobacteraceae bacterium]|nr:ankyrin repeat domain-containing protein [Chthoniobacteraceae bacterium]